MTTTAHPSSKPADQISGDAPQTIPGLFWDRVQSQSDQVALRHKDFGIWQEITWSEYGERVRACAYGLMALGLLPGERVAILSEDRVEWLFADLGTQSAGGISVGLYATASAEQVSYVVRHAEAKIWIVEDQEQFDKAMSRRQDLPDLRWIVVIDPKGLRNVDDPMVLTFDDLLERGRDLAQVEPDRLQERLDSIDPDDTAILFYTSGTTGDPKGVMHSHNSLWGWIQPLDEFVNMLGDDDILCYLPLCHIAERALGMINIMRRGGIVNFAESPETVFSDLVEVAPTFFGGVPRTWERLKSRISIDMAEATWTKRQAYHLALKIGYACNPYRKTATSPPIWLRLLWALAHGIVFRKLRERLGLHRVRETWVGAAPIAPEVLEFFLAIGLPVREGYGATEIGITTFTPANDIRPGKAGVLVPGIEIRISPEGEILFRGPGIMQGYFKNPELTAETLKYGWYHSGDVGEFDGDNYLTLTGRTKDMMITSAGRNIYPQAIENMLKASDYILDTVLIGESRPYLTTLIILDEETISHHAQTHNIPFSTYADLVSKPEIVRLINGEVQKVNARWSDREQIQDFRILNWELTNEDDELTPTMKVRRSFMCEKYADLIEEMYPETE
ncbi:MAG: AMP-binding protein [bacterium]|nr:AMP-binding protein [bacterium]